MKQVRRGGLLITKIHQLTGRILTRKLKQVETAEINPAQGRLLFFLWIDDNISIQSLAEQASLSKSTLTSMLDRLEDGGYIQRVPCQEDRRKILLQLTPKGHEATQDYIRVIREMSQLFYGGFSDEEVIQCEGYLDRIFANLEQFDE